MALAFAVPDKGLSNSAGSNNCFLNVVIQSLWHLGSFRQRFFQWSEQHHTHQAPHSCVFCALSVVFTQYAFCEESSIPPDALRVALDLIYKGDRRFQVGELDDAAEALDAILTCLENGMEKTKKALVAKGAESVRLPHSAFGLTITEQLRCKSCRAAAEPMTSSSFIFYTYSSALARMHQTYPHLSFGQLLFAISDEDFKSCPASETGGCPAKGSVYRHLMSQPDIFTVDIVWESPNPEYADIARTIELVPTELDLNHVFPSVRRKTPYFLRGMICYYGKHYNAYFYSYSKRQWLVYDDSRVIPVAHTWAEIQERCRRGRFQPSVLFYETQGIQKLDAPDLWKVTTTTAAPVADDSGDLPPPYVDAPPSYADVVTDDLPPSYAAATTSSSLPSSSSPSSSSLSTTTPSSSSSSSSSSSQPSIPSTVTPTSPVHYHPRVGTSSPFAQRDRAVFSAFRRMPPGTVAMVPVTSLPPGAIPVSALPPGAIPVSALPPGAVPVSAIPVSSLRPGAGPTPMAAMPYPQPSAPPMMSPAARMRTATPPLPSAPPSSPTPSAPPAFSAPLPVPAVVPIFASAPPAARQPAAPLPAEPALVFSPVPSAPMADEEFDRILSPARDPKWSSLERRVESNPWYSSGQVAPAACPRTAPDSLYKSSVLAKASEETSFLPRGSYSQLPLLF